MKKKTCAPSSQLFTTLASLCIMLALVSLPANGDTTTKLSVADAIDRALDVNANLKQAEANQLTSMSNLKIAGIKTSYGIGTMTGLNHNPDDAGLWTRAFGSFTYDGLVGTEASLDFSPLGLGYERGAVSMTFRKPLRSGSGILSKKADMIAGARSDASIQEKQLYLTRQATVLDVIEAYYQAVLANEQVKVQEKGAKIAEEAADGARKRAEAGLVSGLDVSRAEIRVARTKDQLNIQKQTARAAKDRLMTAIGAGVGEEPELTDGIPEPPTDIPDLAEAITTALDNRAEFAVYDEQLTDQKRKVALAKDQLRPKLDIVAGFNSSNKDAGIISSSLINLGDFRAGLEYRVPLDRRITRENQEIADRNLDVINKLRVLQMENVTEQVRSAYRNVDTSKITLGILGENVKVAEDNLRLAQRMIEEGIDDNRVVLDAQDSLTQVENGLLAARVELYIASINLKYAMGQDLTDMGSK